MKAAEVCKRDAPITQVYFIHSGREIVDDIDIVQPPTHRSVKVVTRLTYSLHYSEGWRIHKCVRPSAPSNSVRAFSTANGVITCSAVDRVSPTPPNKNVISIQAVQLIIVPFTEERIVAEISVHQVIAIAAVDNVVALAA